MDTYNAVFLSPSTKDAIPNARQMTPAVNKMKHQRTQFLALHITAPQFYIKQWMHTTQVVYVSLSDFVSIIKKRTKVRICARLRHEFWLRSFGDVDDVTESPELYISNCSL